MGMNGLDERGDDSIWMLGSNHRDAFWEIFKKSKSTSKASLSTNTSLVILIRILIRKSLLTSRNMIVLKESRLQAIPPINSSTSSLEGLFPHITTSMEIYSEEAVIICSCPKLKTVRKKNEGD